MTVSCLYAGTIRHRRYAERRTEFVHRLALLHLDLDELPRLLDGRLIRRAPGLVRVRRRDYLRPLALPLADAVRETVAAQTGARPHGPVSMLAQARALGHCFNPVSFYYCWASDRSGVQAVVAEVTNTPWGERHAYVLSAPSRPRGVLDATFEKALHVSPFMAMSHEYRMRLTAPGGSVAVHIESRDQAGALQFDATLGMQRRALTRRSLAAAIARDPLPTVRVMALIYAHAARLKLGGVPVHPHPLRSAG